jgi:hypothetical protein
MTYILFICKRVAKPSDHRHESGHKDSWRVSSVDGIVMEEGKSGLALFQGGALLFTIAKLQ